MTASMRVLVVTNTYPTEKDPGSTPCIRDQVDALRAAGVEIDVLHIDRYNKLNYLRAAWSMLGLSLQGKRYDLIHAHYGHSGLLARLQFKYPIVVTFHGSDLLHRKDGAIGKLVCRMVEGVIVMTEQMKSVSRRKDAHVIPFGVDASLFRPYPLEQARRELELPLDKKLVLFPWNPSREVKRFDVVQESVRRLQQERTDVSLEVVFDQPRATIARYMQACDVMIVASNYEGSPMAVREAMACNLPIVSVDVGDIRQIIGDVAGCYLCEREPGDMAEKLATALQRSERTNGYEVIMRMGTDWAASQVLAVYESVLTQRHRVVRAENV